MILFWIMYALVWGITTRLIQNQWDKKYIGHPPGRCPAIGCGCEPAALRLVTAAALSLAWPLALPGVFFLRIPTKAVREAEKAKKAKEETERLRVIAEQEGLMTIDEVAKLAVTGQIPPPPSWCVGPCCKEQT